MSLFEFVDPSYIKLKLDNLDITLTSFRDAIRGVNNKTLSDLDTGITTFSNKFPTAAALSDTLTNPTATVIGSALLGFNTATAVWQRLVTDGSNRLKVQLDAIPNPSNLDVLLSTRSSEATLSAFSNKFPTAASLSDASANPTTTIVGSALLGFDGTNWRRVRVDASARLAIQNPPNLDVLLSSRLSESTFTARIPTLNIASMDIAGATLNALAVVPSTGGDITRMPAMVENISVTTTASSTAIAAPGGKIVKITNKGDVDVLIGINAAVPATNPVKIRPRTTRVFVFRSVTSISYVTGTGSSLIDIEWWN
jgi:hypothetical protein